MVPIHIVLTLLPVVTALKTVGYDCESTASTWRYDVSSIDTWFGAVSTTGAVSGGVWFQILTPRAEFKGQSDNFLG